MTLQYWEGRTFDLNGPGLQSGSRGCKVITPGRAGQVGTWGNEGYPVGVNEVVEGRKPAGRRARRAAPGLRVALALRQRGGALARGWRRLRQWESGELEGSIPATPNSGQAWPCAAGPGCLEATLLHHVGTGGAPQRHATFCVFWFGSSAREGRRPQTHCQVENAQDADELDLQRVEEGLPRHTLKALHHQMRLLAIAL